MSALRAGVTDDRTNRPRMFRAARRFALAGAIVVAAMPPTSCDSSREDGACVRAGAPVLRGDPPVYLCQEQQPEVLCGSPADTFHPNTRCSSVGYSFYCTSDDQCAGNEYCLSGDFWLANPDCDVTEGP